MPDFRNYIPANTCNRTYKRYQTYKRFLVPDFKERCGYCNDHDSWAGGKRGMQIDHFAPKKKFPAQENVYTNLVYSCFYCNNNKSDDWVTSIHTQSVCNSNITGYISPRSATYNASFERSNSGNIIPLSDVAKYMYTQLGFGLKRHRLIFVLEELYDLWQKLTELSINHNIEKEKYEILVEQKQKIADKFLEYLTEYRKVLNN